MEQHRQESQESRRPRQCTGHPEGSRNVFGHHPTEKECCQQGKTEAGNSGLDVQAAEELHQERCAAAEKKVAARLKYLWWWGLKILS